MDDLKTTTLHILLDRLRGGDRAAEEELLRRIEARVVRLCRARLKHFESLRQTEETADIYQNAIMRLLRSLRDLRPASTREFFALASEQIRRELLDLARHYRAARRTPEHGGKLVSIGPVGEDSNAPVDPGTSDETPDDLEQWTMLHESIATLSGDEREVVNLIFYHGWTQAEVAELFQVTERTVRRWWVSACLKIRQSQ